ncbi:MAG TPA: GTP cyclohydrolase I FolE [Euzebyales bacterium]
MTALVRDLPASPDVPAAPQLERARPVAQQPGAAPSGKTTQRPWRRPARVEAPTPHIDLEAAQVAAQDLLVALGADLADESMRKTPARMAEAYAELLTPPPVERTTFPNTAGYDELIVVRAIPFHSLCQHHLLPFLGVAHVGYVPGDRLMGLSKLARVVELFARHLQVQERLTTQTADWLHEHLAPKGIGVAIEAEHLCMSLRGVQKPDARTVTSAFHGLVRDDARTRQEFLAAAGLPIGSSLPEGH